MSEQHTHGPWIVHEGTPAGAVTVYCASGNICVLRHRRQSAVATARTRAETITDARLIACAPEMLDALRQCVIALAHASANDPTCDAAYKAADAAIAKAMGMAANTGGNPRERSAAK